MQLSFMKGHVRMARFTTLPTQALAIGLFAITGFAAASPMAHFVDCTDSFWEVACTTETDADTDTQGDIQSGTDGSDTKTDTDIILGELIAIDDDPVARGDVHNETLRELGVTAIMNQAICGFWLTPWMTETSHEATFHGKPGRR